MYKKDTRKDKLGTQVGVIEAYRAPARPFA